MDAETYIALYGHNLTDAEKRYIRAFGAPEFHEGPANRPYTPSIGIVNAPTGGTNAKSVYPTFGSASQSDPNFPPG